MACERSRALSSKRNKMILALGKQSAQNPQKKYADIMMDRQFKEITTKWKDDSDKVEKPLAETNDALGRAKK